MSGLERCSQPKPNTRRRAPRSPHTTATVCDGGQHASRNRFGIWSLNNGTGGKSVCTCNLHDQGVVQIASTKWRGDGSGVQTPEPKAMSLTIHFDDFGTEEGAMTAIAPRDERLLALWRQFDEMSSAWTKKNDDVRLTVRVCELEPGVMREALLSSGASPEVYLMTPREVDQLAAHASRRGTILLNIISEIESLAARRIIREIEAEEEVRRRRTLQEMAVAEAVAADLTRNLPTAKRGRRTEEEL